MNVTMTETYRLSSARTRAEESLEMALDNLLRVHAEVHVAGNTYDSCLKLSRALSKYHDAKKHSDEANRAYHVHVALTEFKVGA